MSQHLHGGNSSYYQPQQQHAPVDGVRDPAVSNLLEDYFDGIEDVPNEMIVYYTKLRETKAASHHLVSDFTARATTFLEQAPSQSIEERERKMLELREILSSFLPFQEENVYTLRSANKVAEKQVQRLEDLVTRIHERMSDTIPLHADPEHTPAPAQLPRTLPTGNKVVRPKPSPLRTAGGGGFNGGGGMLSQSRPSGSSSMASLSSLSSSSKPSMYNPHSPPEEDSSHKRKNPVMGAIMSPESPPGANGSPRKKLKTNPIQETLLKSLPIYRGKGSCPPLCGPNPAAPDYVMKKGDSVAARTSKAKDDSQEWILATVVRFHSGRNRYEVEDVEEDEGDGKNPGQRKKYSLPAEAIIPLPKSLPDPSKKLEFPAGKKVLALYPGTTCFYEAEVILPPSRRKKDNDYVVQFDDDEESDQPQKPVPQVFVLNLLQNTSSSSSSSTSNTRPVDL